MPFYPPFKNHYTPGDLVYGLGEVRSDKWRDRCAPFSRAEVYDEDPLIVDQYFITAQEKFLRPEHLRSESPPPRQSEFVDSLRTHPKYHVALAPLEDFFSGKYPIKVDAVARKCKGGLNWASNSSTCVHFFLDEIDMQRVVNKTRLRRQTGSSYTARELRWIYRNRYRPEVQRNIQFWLADKPVLPPWEGAGAEIWRSYTPTQTVLSEFTHL